MESIVQLIPGLLDRSVHAVTSVRDEEVEKCHLVSRNPSPVFKRNVEAVETLDKTGNSEEADHADYAESVGSECSVESDASSNSPEADYAEDAISPAFEEKNIKRCPSGGSIVTFDEAPSILREEGECERTRDKKTAKQSAMSHSNGLNDEQETSINAGQESTGPDWTDDKHCSYLNSIEQTFVQSLFGQDYHTVDASGQDDQDCVESRPMYHNPYGREFFISLQRGCYDQREYYRPQFLPTFAPSPAVVLSPWIQHFNPRASTSSYGSAGAGQDAEASNPAAGFVDGAFSAGHSGSGDVKEEVKGSVPNLNVTDMGFLSPFPWCSRYQSQHFPLSSAHVRGEASIQAKKRNCNADPGSDGTYLPKKLKAKRWLAEMDVELDEQFVLKQKSLKEEPQSHGGPLRGIDLNQELVDEDETRNEDPPQTTPTPVTADFGLNFEEPTVTSNKESASEMARNKSDDPKPQQYSFLPEPQEGSGEGSPVVNKDVHSAGCNTPPAGPAKTRQDEGHFSHQADSGFDDEEEFEFLLSRSPRASKTYTWGTVGPRRRLHNDCNLLVEPPAFSGSVKDTRDHEVPNQGNCV